MSQSSLLAFNRGTVSRLALGRLDLKRLAMSAEQQTNWMPRKLGSMMLRPGLGYINTESGKTHLLEFVFSATDTALIELHSSTVTFVKDDVRLTRATVTAVIGNGSFATNLTSWSTVSIAPTWSAGSARLAGDGTGISDLYQDITCNEPNIEHGLRVVVLRGTVGVRICTSYGGSDYVNILVGVGDHSIAFTPTGNFTIVFYNQSVKPAFVDSVAFESGDVALPTPWAEAVLPYVREYQSGDVIFAACRGYQQRRIVRTGTRSWSVEKYAPEDGPFLIENTADTTLTASAITGDITLTASGAATNGVFKSTHVGALFRLSSVGQTVTSSFTAQNQFTNSIRVTGTGAARAFSIVITGTFTATVTLQYSVDDTTWYDRTTYTVPTSTSLTDGLDNQIIYYRLGVKTGDYTSGTAVSSLTFSAGSITGVVRVTGYTSPTVVSAEVLKDLGGTTATNVWAEGAWSDYRGWPSAVTILDGRLWWAGKDRFWGSITDAYSSFDPDYEGDAGPISRSIGFGPVDVINWLLPMDRLVAGTAGSELTCRSSALDEPLTPTNFTPKESSTQGTADIQAIKVDDKVLFVQRCGTRLFELSPTSGNGNYTPEDLSAINPDACSPGVVYVAVQRQPDTRIHLVLSDGSVAVLVFDKAENLICWVEVESDGVIEDVAVLPGEEEDTVYYVVKRTIGGVDYRYLEKWALESEARGAAINKIADSFVYAAAASNTITGLSHLEGETVVAWGGGEDLGSFTVSGGSITLHASTTYTNRCAGLTYQAKFKSAKLAYINGKTGEVSLNRKKKINSLGVVLADTHANGLEYGPDFTTMDPLPEVEQYATVDGDAVREAYEEGMVTFPGQWLTDARLCLRATAPRPCTVIAAVFDME